MKETTLRSYYIQTDNGVSVRRNRQHIKKVPLSVSTENQEYCRISSPSDTHQDKVVCKIKIAIMKTSPKSYTHQLELNHFRVPESSEHQRDSLKKCSTKTIL